MIREKKYKSCDGWYCETFGMMWYIVLIVDGYVKRSKKIGRVMAKKTNYFDDAAKLCDERNAKNGYKPELHIPI